MRNRVSIFVSKFECKCGIIEVLFSNYAIFVIIEKKIIEKSLFVVMMK